MLKYDSIGSERNKNSRFLITSNHGTQYVLSFSTKEIEECDYKNSFLQSNTAELNIARVSNKREAFSKELIKTISEICCKSLIEKDDLIIHISVPINTKLPELKISCKSSIIENCLEKDTNEDIKFMKFQIEGYYLFFIYNTEKTNHILVMNSIFKYLKEEYELNFLPDTD